MQQSGGLLLAASLDGGDTIMLQIPPAPVRPFLHPNGWDLIL